MRDPHRRIIGEIELEPVGDLLGAPGRRPAPVLTSSVTATDPSYVRTCQGRSVHFRDGASESSLDIVAERIVDGELGHFGSPSSPIGMPLCRQGTVVEVATAGRGIPSQFPRDRRWRTMQAPGDRAYATAAGAQQRDLLSFDEGQITTRQRGLTDRRHAPTVPEPAGRNGW